ncbi:major facilitator superfamily domain-containing protein [Apiospora phragmitis]|uniref:Major facilitator superfamily domain-containing protein n=1 Tax=Apiospora phragmitis TaxID=2905665 RepID=A0ABR1W7B8_9PEZI
MDTITPDTKLPAGVLAEPLAAAVAGSPNTTPTETHLDLVESPKVRTKLRLYAILSALYLALFVAALDQTIVSIAIPTITSDLHSAQGYCSDIWGRKPPLLAAVALFTGASLLAALSPGGMRALLAGRALQGAASGGLMQLVTIVISDLFSVRKRSLYLGYVGFVWALAGAAGRCSARLGWRWCFWINLPIGVLTFLLLALFLDVHNPHTRLDEGVKAIDWIGTVSILAITLLLLLGLDFGGAIFPWNSPKVICLIVFGGLMIGVFLFGEQRLARYPIIPLTIFKDGSNNATFIVAFAHGMVLIGIEYYLPLFLQSVLQASPLRSGILMLPLIGTQAVVEILAGMLIHRTGRYRELIWAGAALMTLGTGLYILFGPETSVAVVVGLEVLGALGPALLFQSPMVSIQNNVSPDETTAATACLGFVRNLAMALSVVLGGVVFQNSMEAQQASLVAAGLDASARAALSGSQAAANVGITQSIKDLSQRHTVLEAFAGSVRNMFIMYTCLSAVTLVASAFIKHRKLNDEHTETKTGIQSLTKAG